MTGTGGNDTFTADNTTFSATDTINAGAGIDTLNFTDSGTVGGALAAAQVSNVEIINIRNINNTTTAVAQKTVITFAATPNGSGDTLVVTYGTQTQTVTTGATNVTAAAAIAIAINALAGATIAFAANGVVTVTAPVAGTPLPAIGLGGYSAIADSTGNTTAVTVANTVGTGGADTVAAGNFIGATDFNSNLSTNGVTVTGLATAQKVGVIGNGSVATGALSFAYATPTDAATVNVVGGTKVGTTITNTGAGATAVTINSTGAANTVGAVQLASGATVKTLTVNATTNLTMGAVTNLATDAAVNIAGAAASVSFGTTALAAAKTIDASGLTAGGVTVTLDTVVTSFKGGQGNDVVTTAATTASTAVIDAGAGTDVLNIALTNDVNTAAKGTQYLNFETLRLNASQDVSLVAGITALQLNGQASGVFTNISAAQAGAITVRDNQTTALTLTLKDATGTADVVGLTLSNIAAAATPAVPTSTSVANLSIIGVETLNVVAAGGVTALTAPAIDSITFATGGATTLTAINVTGASSFSIDGTNTAKAVTIDASALSGSAALNVLGALVKGSVVTASANADTIATGTTAIAGAAGDFVTYNAGAGNDTITTTLAALNNTNAGFASIKIDGGAGTDTVVTDAGTYADANFQFITNVEKLTFTGSTALNLTTGGFFDTNFKTAGVTITAATLNGGTANVVDATSFTGKVTTALTETGTTVTDSFVVKSGGGDDVIALTTVNALTTTNSITTGLGNDTVTLVAATLGTGGAITISTGAGNDTITTGAAAVTIIGGTGADLITVHSSGAGVATLNQGIGDSGVFVKPATNTISTAGFDVLKGGVATDKISLTAQSSFNTVVAQGSDLSAAALTFADQVLTDVRGTYNAVSNTFVGSSTGADSLLVADTTSGSIITLEGIVLVGVTNLVSVTSAGLIALT